jgi:hypothetical protein
MRDDKMVGSLEIRLFNFIKELHKEIVDMKPEGGFSSPRDYELVTEVNKKAAILDKLQEAMRVYNPDFEYEPKEERQNVLDKKFTHSGEWMKKKYEDYDFNQDYLNVWKVPSNVTDIKTIMIPYEFNFKDNVNPFKELPVIIKVINDNDLSYKSLFIFNIIEDKLMENRVFIDIPYEEVKTLFKVHVNLDIEPLGLELKDYYLMVLTKSNNLDSVRFFFKIII